MKQRSACAYPSQGGIGRLPPPRDRILDVAREMFYWHGIRAVGVEAIAEAAGTNKMTLYRHFASKDALVVECLRGLAELAEAEWQVLRQQYPDDPYAQLHGWLRLVSDFAETAGRRGCGLANAAVELPEADHPARRIIEEFKRDQRNQIVALCQSAGIGQPDRLADELFLLIEGARVSIQSAGPDGPGSRLLDLAERLIAPEFKRAAARKAGRPRKGGARGAGTAS